MSDAFVEVLDREVPGLLDKLSLPGINLAVIEGCEVVATRCFGYADIKSREPLGEDHLFRLASISKPVTAWGVMTLVDSGLVDLDAPIDDYLERWHLPPSDYDPAAVTARGLLSHTAGLAAGGGSGTNPRYDLPSLVESLNGENTPPLDDDQLNYYEHVGLALEEVQRTPTLEAPAGQRFVYSNCGYAILQLMIEDVSHQTFCDFMKHSVLQPLGMHASSFVNPDDARGFATSYDDAGKTLPIYKLVAKAAGGLNATIGDLATFTCAEMAGAAGEPAGRSVVSEAAVRAMHEPLMYAETEMGIDFYTGLGHLIAEVNGRVNVHHTGGFAGWRSVMAFVPESGDGFAALINSSGGNPLWMQLVEQWSDYLATR